MFIDIIRIIVYFGKNVQIFLLRNNTSIILCHQVQKRNLKNVIGMRVHVYDARDRYQYLSERKFLRYIRLWS